MLWFVASAASDGVTLRASRTEAVLLLTSVLLRWLESIQTRAATNEFNELEPKKFGIKSYFCS